ncbi:hypothetical protein ACLBOM_37505 [Escherichia coli]
MIRLPASVRGGDQALDDNELQQFKQVQASGSRLSDDSIRTLRRRCCRRGAPDRGDRRGGVHHAFNGFTVPDFANADNGGELIRRRPAAKDGRFLPTSHCWGLHIVDHPGAAPPRDFCR